MSTEAPSWPDADAPAQLLLGDSNPAYTVTPIRIGALLLFTFQIAYLGVGPYQVPAAARLTVPLHALNLLLAAAVLGATHAEVFSAYWRALVWWSLSALLVSSTLIGLSDNQPDPLFVSVLLILVGAGVLVPWGWRRQVALEMVGIACLLVASLTTGFNLYFWMTLATTIALVRLTRQIGRRDRRRISQSMQRQARIPAPLLDKIAELELAERRARTGEEMVRRIIETSPDVITINRLSDGSYVTANSGFTQTTGFTSGEVLGKSPADLGIWADRKQARAFVERVSSEPIVRNLEMDLRHKDGRIIPHLLSAVVTEIGGEPCVITIGRDIHSIRETELELRAVRAQLLLQVEALRANEDRLRAEAVEREQVISERELAAAKLRESETGMRQLFDQNPDSMAILDLETGRYVDINQEYTRSTGFCREDVVGKRSRDFFPFVNAEEGLRYAEELKRAGVLRNMEATFRRKDGSSYHGLISGVSFKLRGHLCLVSINRDISVLKKTQDELIAAHEAELEASRAKDRIIAERELTAANLRESEMAMRQLFDQNLDSMSIIDLETGRYIDINEEYTRNTGFCRDDIVGKRSREVKSMAIPEENERLSAELKRAGLVRNMEATFRRKDGSSYYGLISAVNLKLRGHMCCITITRDIGVLKETQHQLIAAREAALEAKVRLEQEVAERDRAITESELTAAKLRESETALRQLFDQSLDAMQVLDLETGRFIDVNEEHTRHTGYSREETVGKSSREIQFFDNPEEHLRYVEELKRVGLLRNMEATFRRKDGSTYCGLISAFSLKLRGNLCCVSITRDISELKETQHQLIAEHEAALEASRAKSEFLSTMSHEIRTPMNAVLGMTELLANSPLTDEQRRWVDVMSANGDTLLDLINDILDLAKIESGRLTIEHIALDLEELIDKLGDIMGVRAHEKGLEFAIRIAPDVPRNLVGDPLRLRQILVNLLGNAIKFTDLGQIVLSVERAGIAAAGRPDPDQIGLRFAIRDTGIGIPKDKLSIIFSNFSQADSSTTRRYGGSGLGLTIARRLVKLFGGEITVESEPGVGSCFSFVAMFGIGRAVAPRARAANVILRDVETLIVDDTGVNRLILREILESEGARVTEAPGGADALQELEKASATGRRFELILLDCRMPGMDGLELAARIREFYANGSGPPPVVMMLTSDEMNVRLPQLHELGVRAYLVKPIRRAELIEAIGRAMGGAAVAESTVRPLAAEVTGALRGLRILLADDSPDNRMLVRAFLSKTGCQLDEAEDGREAFARFTTGNYDLVLMDIRMPVIDGIEATRAIRRWENENRARRTPIIALTASALPLAVRTCLAAGCDTHVSKPIKRATLIDTIRAEVDADTACSGARVAQ